MITDSASAGHDPEQEISQGIYAIDAAKEVRRPLITLCFGFQDSQDTSQQARYIAEELGQTRFCCTQVGVPFVVFSGQEDTRQHVEEFKLRGMSPAVNDFYITSLEPKAIVAVYPSADRRSLSAMQQSLSCCCYTLQLYFAHLQCNAICAMS